LAVGNHSEGLVKEQNLLQRKAGDQDYRCQSFSEQEHIGSPRPWSGIMNCKGVNVQPEPSTLQKQGLKWVF
jgi:hypothetical protein